MDDLLPRRTVAVGRELLSTFPAVVITLDDRRTRDAAVADESAFVEQCPDGVLVVDEVQREPELLLAIKASIDRDRRPGRFLLTGSADLLTVKGRTDSLAGRAATLHLRGLSQGELAGRPEDFVSSLLASTAPHGFTPEGTRADTGPPTVRGASPNTGGFGHGCA